MDFKQKFKVFSPLIRNKYVVTTLFFLIWVLFFDQTSLIDRFSLLRNIKTLEKERESLKKEIQKNRDMINDLQTNTEKLEKFAREEYLMKKPDEDIFILIYE